METFDRGVRLFLHLTYATRKSLTYLGGFSVRKVLIYARIGSPLGGYVFGNHPKISTLIFVIRSASAEGKKTTASSFQRNSDFSGGTAVIAASLCTLPS